MKDSKCISSSRSHAREIIVEAKPQALFCLFETLRWNAFQNRDVLGGKRRKVILLTKISRIQNYFWRFPFPIERKQ